MVIFLLHMHIGKQKPRRVLLCRKMQFTNAVKMVLIFLTLGKMHWTLSHVVASQFLITKYYQDVPSLLKYIRSKNKFFLCLQSYEPSYWKIGWRKFANSFNLKSIFTLCKTFQKALRERLTMTQVSIKLRRNLTLLLLSGFTLLLNNSQPNNLQI